MTVPQFGDSSAIFPILLGEADSNTITRSITQDMGLADLAELASVYRLAADRVFYAGALGPDGQEATHNYIFADVENVFSFDNTAGYNWYIEVRQWIGLTGPRWFSGYFGNYLGLQDRVNIAVSESVSNAFSFNSHDDPAEALKRAYNAQDALGLSDTATGGFSLDVRNDFDLDDLVDSSGTEYDRAPTHQVIKQHLSFRVTGPTCLEKEYAPHIGGSDDTSYDEVPSVGPSLGSGTLTLTYPRVTPTSTLVLKNPEFGDANTVSFTRLDRATRGGERKIFSDSKWAQKQTFDLTVRNVCNVTVDQIVDFLNASLGKEIGLEDWDGRDWKGIILEPETNISKEVNGYTVQIAFEGELV